MQKKPKVKSQAGPKPRSKFSLSVTLQAKPSIYSVNQHQTRPTIKTNNICFTFTLLVRKIVRFQIYERSSPALLQVHIVQTQFGGGASFSVFSTPGVKNLIVESTQELETLALFKYEYEEGQL